MNLITGSVDYISGYLKYAHYELELNDEDFEEFKSLSLKEQIETLREDGDLILDHYEINDIGKITEIEY